jgi:hypothetical protein
MEGQVASLPAAQSGDRSRGSSEQSAVEFNRAKRALQQAVKVLTKLPYSCIDCCQE